MKNKLRRMMLLGAGLLLAGCTREQVLPGRVEMNTLAVHVSMAGFLLEAKVKDGDVVTSGQPLYILETPADAAGRRKAMQRVADAEAELQDLIARQNQPVPLEGEPPPPVTEGQIRQQRDNVEIAQLALARYEKWVLNKVVLAPSAGTVGNFSYKPGDWVSTRRPAMTIQPPDAAVVWFDVPEAVARTWQVGQTLPARREGSREVATLTVSYIAEEPSADSGVPVLRVETKPPADTHLAPNQTWLVKLKRQR
ncbi:MAG: HlyD family efflux transporter periplasmic adaptor subunit [Kiritimatiellia bacterium]|nr:HlyD family efflux transporter periplasmic adaptor subunit [Kiritimatiellia bacterium]MBP9572052.1 HlyD family efflux transporter periplasmic adaptor subunit [Kiritimatiellia bacterium]